MRPEGLSTWVASPSASSRRTPRGAYVSSPAAFNHASAAELAGFAAPVLSFGTSQAAEVRIEGLEIGPAGRGQARERDL